MQSNAASSEETAATSEELSAQAAELHAISDVLMGVVGGAAIESHTGPRKRTRTMMSTPDRKLLPQPK